MFATVIERTTQCVRSIRQHDVVATNDTYNNKWAVNDESMYPRESNVKKCLRNESQA